MTDLTPAASGEQIAVCRDDLVESLRTAAGRDDPGDPAGVCLVSGTIVARTLRERLATEGIPTDVVRVTTIESLARDLLAAADRPTGTLDRPLRRRAVETVLGDATDRDSPLGRFARRVPWEGADVLDAVTAELNEYHRCTDAARDADHDALLGVVDRVADDHPFGATATRENLRAFRVFDRRLREYTPDHVSRSHLVRAARDAVPDVWADVVGDPDWVALATVSALDNPTLRFLLAIADLAPLRVFAGAGTAETFLTRFDAAADDDVAGPVGGPPVEGPPAEQLVAAAAEDRRIDAPGGVAAVAAPDRRREIEHVVGETTGPVLAVARDAAEYETPLRDVSLVADRPYRVETRRELSATAPYRLLAATIELLAATDEPVRARDVLDPLRFGVVVPGDADGGSPSADGEWPLGPSALRSVERLLGGSSAEKPLPAWRDTVASADLGPGEQVLSFLDWVLDRAGSPPDDGRALRGLADDLLEAHVAAVADDPVRALSGIAVETPRARATEKHPAYVAGRVRRVTGEAATAYDWLCSADGLDQDPTWATALLAVRSGVGSQSFGLPNDDAHAIEVVDAGNAYFRRADHVFVLGLAAERFPGTPRTPAFLHRAVRAAVHRRAAESPFLYLDGEAARYERDLDAYEAALGVARERVTLLRTAKDREGRDVAPSPFVEGVSVPDERRTRIDPGDWATAEGMVGPGGSSRGDEDGAHPRAPAKERLRTVARYADRSVGGGPDAETLSWLVRDVDPDTRRAVRDRAAAFRRYLAENDDQRWGDDDA